MTNQANRSWQLLSDSDRERAYSPSSCLPDGDYRPFVESYRAESIRSRALVEASGSATIQTLRYGDGIAQTIDIAVPNDVSGEVPVLVFFHGGYWQELSKAESFFPAWSAIEQGWAYAAVDYTLAPEATLDEIVDECRQAMETVRSEAARLGLDPSQIVVAGSSAGAHLAAMVGLTQRSRHARLAGAVLVSGVYDLEPLLGTSINEALGLDRATALRNSPLFADVAGFPTTVLAYGDNETSEFMTQTLSFAHLLEAAGVEVSAVCVEDRNHFDVIMDLAEPDSVLGSLVATMMDAGGRRADH